MTVQDYPRVIDDVRKLLSKTYYPKLIRGGTPDAIRIARDAFNKANDLLEESSPWRHLAAYRLAHLLLRQDGSLKEIDELFSITEGAGFLEPLRSCCHLAVLHRIRDDLRTPVERDAVTARLKEVFAIATDSLRSRTFRKPDIAKVDYQAQDSSFNMVEVLSYALGLPHDQLEGITREADFRPYEDRQSESHAWQILSRDSISVWMTEDFARQEFKSFAKSFAAAGDCIAVEIAPSGSKWAFPRGEKLVWKNMREHSDLLIAALLEKSAITMSELRREVVGSDDADAKEYFRQVKSRTRKDVRHLTSKGQLAVFEDRAASDMIDLTDEISFLVLKKYRPRRG
jgi:hypothetical protein